MNFPDIFDQKIVEQTIARLDNLRVDTPPLWGKMNAAQALAHMNVAYDLAYGRKEVKNSPFKKWLLRMLVKPTVTNDKPYKKNSRTAPEFIVSDERDFQKEKELLTQNLKDTLQKGKEYFEGRESSSFGKMTAQEWNQQFSKHLSHHFEQFGL